MDAQTATNGETSQRDTRVTVTRFAQAPSLDRKLGLLGWASLEFDGLWRIDGVAVRRTSEGRISVFFPERTDNSGRRHRVIWPVAPWLRREVERQVVAQLLERAGRRGKVLGQ